MITVPPQGDHIKGDDLGSAFGISTAVKDTEFCAAT